MVIVGWVEGIETERFYFTLGGKLPATNCEAWKIVGVGSRNWRGRGDLAPTRSIGNVVIVGWVEGIETERFYFTLGG